MRQAVPAWMRALSVVAVMLCAGTTLAQTGADFGTPESVDFSVLPADIEKLRNLDSRHRAIARRAARMCSSLRGTLPRHGLYNDPCVRRNVETGLEEEGDSRLWAFHHAVPLRVRYDGLRTEVDWRAPVEKVIARHAAPLPRR